MNSPVCKCAVPKLVEDCKGACIFGTNRCHNCGEILPKEVKCSCLEDNKVSQALCTVHGRVDKMIGGAVRRLGSEGKVYGTGFTEFKADKNLSWNKGDEEVIQNGLDKLYVPNTEASLEDTLHLILSPAELVPDLEAQITNQITDLLFSEKNKAREEGYQVAIDTETMKEYLAEAKQKGRDEAVDYIKTYSGKATPSSPYEVFDQDLEAARSGKVC